MVMCGVLLFAAIPFDSVFVRADEQGDEAKRERELLADAGFKPTAEGSILFLDRLRSNDLTRQKVAQLISRLGHSSFFTRQRATRSLESLGLHAESQLLRASKSDDLEIAFQTQRLLKTIRSGRDPELHDARIVAALGILSRQRHRDTVTTIVDTIPVLSNTKQLKQASLAVWFAARSSDLEKIRAALGSEYPAVRVAAIPALELIAGERSVKEIEPLLSDRSDAIRLAAARALLDRMPGRCMSVLIDLLDADDRMVKLQAAWLISRAFGEPEGEIPELHFKEQTDIWRQRVLTLDVSVLNFPMGARRLELKEYGIVFREDFRHAIANIQKLYGQLRYESTVPGARGSVKQGVARLHGDHNEGDQRLFITAPQIVGKDSFTKSFYVEAQLGGEAKGTGAYHVGISIGNLRVLFHPGYMHGGFRIERVDNNRYLVTNQSMPFTPSADVFHKMRVIVEPQPDNRVLLKAIITNGQNPSEKYLNTFMAEAADIGPLTRVGIERSGRAGGDALFRSLTIDATGIDESR